MVAARVAEAVYRDERAVFPVGSFNSRYEVALSLPSVVGRQGVVETFLPDMSDDEMRALARSDRVESQTDGIPLCGRPVRIGHDAHFRIRTFATFAVARGDR